MGNIKFKLETGTFYRVPASHGCLAQKPPLVDPKPLVVRGFLWLCFRFQNRDTLNHCLNRRPNGMKTNRTTLGALRRSTSPDLRPPIPILVPGETVSRRFIKFPIYGLDASRAVMFIRAPSFMQTSPMGNGTMKTW